MQLLIKNYEFNGKIYVFCTFKQDKGEEVLPYRRLPNTDAARLRALEAAMLKADQLEHGELAFTDRFIHPLRNFHKELESIKFQQEQTWRQMVNQNKSFQQDVEKTRLYLTHFIQVMNMCIIREEMRPDTRKYYGLDVSLEKMPKMQSDEELLEWGYRIIEGEGKRIRNGGNPIMNPTIAKVKVWFERFKDGHHSKVIANKSYQRISGQLVDLRRKTDGLIQAVWNEVEEYFEELPEWERRKRAAEYGVVYVLRRNEKPPTEAGLLFFREES